MANKRKNSNKSEKQVENSNKADNQIKLRGNKNESKFDHNNNLDTNKVNNIANKSGEQISNDETKPENQICEKKLSRSALNVEAGRFDDPIHESRISLFSSASGFTNYRGLLNLCVVLLIMSMSRLVLENIIKYGVLVRFNFPFIFLKDPTAWPSFLALVGSNLNILGVLFSEKLIAKKIISEPVGIVLGVTNGLLALTAPAIYLSYKEVNPVSAFFTLSTFLIISLKIFSYLHVNKTCRYHKRNTAIKIQENVNENEKLVQYPDNLNLKDIYYFMCAPTLCYELNFPRSERIHVRFLIRRLGEIAFLFTIELVLIQQWIIPILKNSKIPFRESSYSKIAERLLKLAVPNHVIWLIFFYSFFHSWLNILAEVLRFGDREFYNEWWNSESINEFWSKWNIPVHRYCSRHIFKPLLKHGFSRFQSVVIVFMVSAFFHEYLVSLPLRMFRLWAFLGMLFQIPLSLFVQRYLHGHYGNIALWVSLIIGQPLAIMMYIHDYFIDYFQTAPN